MIPASFEYERPESLADALRALTDGAGAARAIAGGQSLLPLMKLRLARPERLVDIGRFEELRGVRPLAAGGMAIGAMTTWAALLESREVMACGALADAIPRIGDVQVRNRGTIGGSLAHADPASDIAGPLLALDAEIVLRSSQAERVIAAGDLYAGPFMTSLEPDELITEIRLPGAAAGVASASAYVALPHPASGYPIAGVAAVARRVGASWQLLAAAVTGVGETPYRVVALEGLGEVEPDLSDALARLTEGHRVLADPYADREYRAAMAVVMARRAIDRAAARAVSGNGV
jgi:aerobic carbon-monoxide dehydrogenase medium subunit